MNLSLVFFLIYPKLCSQKEASPVEKMGKEIEKFIEQDIGLSESVAVNLNKSRQELYKTTQKIREDLRKQEWLLIKEAVSLKTRNEKNCKIKLDLIAENSKKLSWLLHEHMVEIRNLCNKKQAEKLKNMLEEIFRMSNLKSPPPPRNFKATAKINIK